MNNTFKISALALAALLAAACTKNSDAPEIGSSSFAATFEEADTKTQFGTETSGKIPVMWEANDLLWVRTANMKDSYNEGACFFTNSSSISPDGRTATFTGTYRTDSKGVAIYPYEKVTPNATYDNLTIDVPSSQTFVPGNCQSGANLALACWDGAATSLSFKYLLGALKLSLTGSGETVTKILIIDGNANLALWGTGSIKIKSNGTELDTFTIANSSADKNIMTVNCNLTLSSTPAETYIMLPANALKAGFRIELYNGSTLLKTIAATASGNAIVRGTAVKMPSISPSDVTEFSGGQGTSDNPYIIANANDFVSFSNKVNAEATNATYGTKYYKQACDIDFSGVSVTPVGKTAALAFKGSYDGNGRYLKNLSLKEASGDGTSLATEGACGVFAYIQNATIAKVNLENYSNTGTFGANGGICGYCIASTITGCSNYAATINATGNGVGGIVGIITGGSTVNTNQTLKGSVINGGKNVGGVIGAIDQSSNTNLAKVKECYFKGTSSVTGTGENVGGIVGGPWDVSKCAGILIDNCYIQESSKITGLYHVGGMLGYYNGSTANCGVTVINCGIGSGYLTVTGYFNSKYGLAGGMIGRSYLSLSTCYTKVVNCFAYLTEISFTNSAVTNLGAAGIVGFCDGTAAAASAPVSIINCLTNLEKSKIKVNGTAYTGSTQVGGIYGRLSNNANTAVTDCYYMSSFVIGPSFASTTQENNTGVTTDIIKGDTVLKGLNDYVSAHPGSGDEKLMTWTKNSANYPYI